MRYLYSTMKNLKGGFMVLFIAIFCHVQLMAQCSFDIPTPIVDQDTTRLVLNVTGADVNNLSTFGQGVCGVELDFRHDFVGHLTIELISPFGQSIFLISEPAMAGFTSFTRWRVRFIPCNDFANPDPGFLPRWSNNQSWGILGNFTGTYFPQLGCLEDFNTGPVNGRWTLRIVDNGQFYTGNLLAWRIQFCNIAGIQCAPCAANAPDITASDISMCQGNAGLNFTPQGQYNGALPDSNLYKTEWMLLRQDTILGLYNDIQLSPFPTGLYEVCSFSYQKNDSIQIHATLPGTTKSSWIINLNSSFAQFCGKIGDKCQTIKILPNSTLTKIDTILCQGDTLRLGVTDIFNPGNYSLTFQNIYGCDSLVNLTVQSIDFDISLPETDTLYCHQIKVISPMWSSINPLDSIHFDWINLQTGQILATGPDLSVSQFGNYTLRTTSYKSTKTCLNFDTIIIHKHPVLNTTNAILNISNCVLCVGQESTITLNFLDPKLPYSWNFAANGLNITNLNDSTLMIKGQVPGVDTILVTIFDECHDMSISQMSTIVNTQIGIINAFPDTLKICGLEGFLASNDPSPGIWSVLGASKDITIVNTADPNSAILASFPGVFRLKRQFDTGICMGSDTLSVVFNVPPALALIVPTNVLCRGDEVWYGLNVPAGTVDVTVNFNNGNQNLTQIISDTRSDTIRFMNNTDTLILDNICYRSKMYPNCPTQCSIINFNYSFVDENQWSLDNTLKICNDTSRSDGRLKLENLILQGDRQGTWLDALGNSLSDQTSWDCNDCLAGVYKLRFSPSIADCLDDLTVSVLVESCVCSPLLTRDSLAFCYSSRNIDISSALSNISSIDSINILGDGSDYLMPMGIKGQFSIIQNLDASVLLEIISNDSIGRCYLKDTIKVKIYAFNDAGADISLSYCADFDELINLPGLNRGQSSQGKWYSYPKGDLIVGVNDTLILINYKSADSLQGYQYITSKNELCEGDSAIVFLTPKPSPKVNIGDSLLIDCAGTNITISDGNAYNSQNYYGWYLNGFFYADNTNYIVTNIPGRYELDVKNSFDCWGGDGVEVVKQPNSIINIDFEKINPTCSYNDDGMLVIKNVDGQFPPFDMFLDSNSFIGTVFDIKSGSHSLHIIDSKGCTQDTILEYVNPPALVLELGQNRTLINSQSVTLTPIKLDSTGIDYYWLNSDFNRLCGVNCTSITAFIESDTIFYYELKDSKGCIVVDSIFIKVVKNKNSSEVVVPNIFSPNGDHINDELDVYFNEDVASIQSMFIFDRWGSQLWSQKNIGEPSQLIKWDGKTLSGKQLNIGVYVLMVSYKTKQGIQKTYVKDITLVY